MKFEKDAVSGAEKATELLGITKPLPGQERR